MNSILEKIIRRNPELSWISDRTIFLTVHGSRAYDTNIETSDFDYKGICVPTKDYYFGISNTFEQAELKDPDTVIYEIRKFFDLASQSNPNVIEVLHTDPSDHLHVSPIGEMILNHKDEFLSKRVKYSFLGYAFSQLKRIKLHRGYLLNPLKEYPTRASMGLPEFTLIPQDQFAAAQAEIRKELDKFQFDFMEDLSEPTKIGIRSVVIDLLAELKITAEEQWMSAARKIGLSDNFIEIMQRERAYASAKKTWDKYQEWKKERNEARAELEAKFGYDTKHAMHLVRLTRMGQEILSTGKVIVKRPDREELLAIRAGAWSYDQLIEFAEQQEKAINALYHTCDILPKVPDRNSLNKLCISCIEIMMEFPNLMKRTW